MPIVFSNNTRSAVSGIQSHLESLERSGSAFINQLTDAIKQESWALKLLALAWAAGPVTYLALHVGFRLGYGKNPPWELIVYFGGYTVITGLISILVKVFLNATVNARKKAVEKVVAEVIAKIPDLIIAIRNLGVQGLTPERRRLRGATYLLSDPDATESSIETALEDLSGNREMARRFRRLESFRKKGLSILVREEADVIRENFSEYLQSIIERSAYVSSLLENRLAGRTPSKRFGQRRQLRFIQRIIEAVNCGREDDIDLIDTMEMYKLILELLMDREFTVLRWKLSGSHPMVAASRKLEQIVKQRQGSERKIRLTKYCVLRILDQSINKDLLFAAGKKGDKRESYPFTMSTMPDFNSVDRLLSQRSDKDSDELAECLVRIREKEKELAKLNKKELEAAQNFFHCRDQYKLSMPPYDENGQPESVSVRFDRSSIRFLHKDKIHFAEHLHHYLANLTSNQDRTRLFAEGRGNEAQDESRNITTEELQGIALRVFAELENILDLSEEPVINALEASTAINVGTIEQSLSRRIKIGWLQALVDEMEDINSGVALKTAQRLVDYFQCPLPNSVAKTLSHRFQLPLEELTKLIPLKKGGYL